MSEARTGALREIRSLAVELREATREGRWEEALVLLSRRWEILSGIRKTDGAALTVECREIVESILSLDAESEELIRPAWRSLVEEAKHAENKKVYAVKADSDSAGTRVDRNV